jgi:hypothetical protein
MTQYFLNHGSQLNRDEFLTIARETYKSSQFRKILEAIEKM